MLTFLDIAGALFVTCPNAKEMDNSETLETRKRIEKYLAGSSKTTTKDRIKVLRLIENLTVGRAAVGYPTESMHGAGSPQAQRIMINRMSNMEEKKKFANDLAQISSNRS